MTNPGKMPAVETPSALPASLKLWWFFSFPIAALFAARIMWEKTVWTWSRGPQMVGFSLMHIHPIFAIVGMLFCLAVMVWLLPAIPFAIARRKIISLADVAMVACALFVAVAIVIPNNFFA
jgi:hypothetical protein